MMINADGRSPKEFWAMDAQQFNKWRKDNDYPRILDYFKNYLRGFSTWLSEFRITEGDLIEFGITNFLVMEELTFFTRTKADMKSLLKVRDSEGKETSFISMQKNIIGDKYKSVTGSECEVIECKSFRPYLLWAKDKHIQIHPQANDGRIKVTLIDHAITPDSKTFVFGELELLKLGGLNSLYSSALIERQLDFVNLDFIQFERNTIGSSYTKQILFSSARNWNFQNSEESFFHFFETNLENLLVESCHISGWRWLKCEGGNSSIRNSRLAQCVFGAGRFIPHLENIDLIDSDLEKGYESSYEFGFKPSAELARRL